MLTDIEKVRLLIGDIDESNYVLTDSQVEFYLTTNDDDIDKAAADAKIAVSQILAIRAVNIRTEDMWEDSRDASKRYNESLQQELTSRGVSAYPIIGGGDYKGATIDGFDEDNDYNTEDTFYNDI